MKKLSPDDTNLLRTLREIPSQGRLDAIMQILEWKDDGVRSAAFLYLFYAGELERSPDCPKINFEFGKVTERMKWAAARVPGTRGATPETLALSKLKSLLALGPGRRAENARRAEDRNVRVSPLQQRADEIWKRHPHESKSSVEAIILRTWRSADGPRPKVGYIRKRIKKVGQA